MKWKQEWSQGASYWWAYSVWGNENSIILWSGDLTGQNCFGDWGRDWRVTLIWILKYLQCELMFPYNRVRWWSVVNRGLNCCSVREGIAWLCGSWVVETDCGLWGYPELITAASVKCKQCKGKIRIQIKECYKRQFSWQLSSRTLQTAIIDINNIQSNTTKLIILLRCISYIVSFDMFRL